MADAAADTAGRVYRRAEGLNRRELRMNDLLSIARRMEERAAKPGVSDLDREDFLTSAYALRQLHIRLSEEPKATNGKDSPIPG